MSDFYSAVYKAVKQIPKGKVTTYGRIAAYLGCPKMSRQVGWALHANPEFMEIPCHRVVNRFGRLANAFAFGGAEVQKELLQAEGVKVTDDTVDLSVYGFDYLNESIYFDTTESGRL
ncbi:MAG: MGMT family protein [Clostridia bacterium]|nr:MGMT family protein [Clostridia bacterium]